MKAKSSNSSHGRDTLLILGGEAAIRGELPKNAKMVIIYILLSMPKAFPGEPNCDSLLIAIIGSGCRNLL